MVTSCAGQFLIQIRADSWRASSWLCRVSPPTLLVVERAALISQPSAQGEVPPPARLVKRPMALPLRGLPVQPQRLEPACHGKKALPSLPLASSTPSLTRSISRASADPVLRPAFELVGLMRVDSTLSHKVLSHPKLVLPNLREARGGRVGDACVACSHF